MSPAGIRLEEAHKIVDLAATRNEIKDTIRLLEQSVVSKTGVTSAQIGANERGFIPRRASVQAAEALLIVLNGNLDQVNAELADARFVEDPPA